MSYAHIEVSFSQRYADEAGETNTTIVPNSNTEARMHLESICADLMNAGAFQYDWSNCEAFASARLDSSGQVDAALFIIDKFYSETIITVIVRGADRKHFDALAEVAAFVTDTDNDNIRVAAIMVTGAPDRADEVSINKISDAI